jgi:hypothetical protein
MHASHSCIIVTETPENEPETVEPAETVEPELVLSSLSSRKKTKASS